MMKKSFLMLGAAAVTGLTLIGCDVEQVEEGNLDLPDVQKTQEGNLDVDLPKYESSGGDVKLPEYDVKGPDVDVDTGTKTIEVPTMDVDVNSAQEGDAAREEMREDGMQTPPAQQPAPATPPQQ